MERFFASVLYKNDPLNIRYQETVAELLKAELIMNQLLSE